jgi:hypothetical protein
VTYTTQPDLLPVPDDGSQPAQALQAFRALADATQAALLRRDATVTTGGAVIIDGANNPVTIHTGLAAVQGATATNGNPAVEMGQVIGMVIDGADLRVYHTFTAGSRQINWMAVGSR